MSMSEEQLNRTGILRIMLNNVDSSNDEMTILEKIELFEDKIDYMNIIKEKKNKLHSIIDKIKEEDNERVQEFLFQELLKTLQDD